MAAKIVRQPNKIALLGAPISAAATMPGRDGAPHAIRAAGLVAQLQSVGYVVADLGDGSLQLYQPDDQTPRAKNLPRVLAALEELKPRIEIAVKSGALPLILSGDSSIALATVAGVRRYFHNVGMVYMDGDAGLHTPATTTTGSVDGMVVSHLAGRGAAELVRFWGEPPLVREPDLALFGTERIDPTEEEAIGRSPLRRYLSTDVKRMGPIGAAEEAVERIHANRHEFVLHLDVDVIADFQATDLPSTGGLSLAQVREAAEVFVTEKHLAAIEVTGYNPTRDSDGTGAKVIVDLISGLLRRRLEFLNATAPAVSESRVAPADPDTSPAQPEASAELPGPTVAPREAWSSGPEEGLQPPEVLERSEAEPPTASDEPDQSHS